MRHFYFRLGFGIVLLVCMIYSCFNGNIQFALMYLVMGGAFIYSAYLIRKKNKDKDDRRK